MKSYENAPLLLYLYANSSVCHWLCHGHISSLTLMNYNHEIAVKSHKNYGDVKFSCFNRYKSLIYLLVDLSKPDLARKSQNKNLTLQMHFQDNCDILLNYNPFLA